MYMIIGCILIGIREVEGDMNIGKSCITQFLNSFRAEQAGIGIELGCDALA
ncbi:hypothetical protein D1872_260560 [compost metagenome]